MIEIHPKGRTDMKKHIDTSRAARGFTLIELMIAVAIVAILASTAYPAYADYIRRAQLPEGMTYLSDYRVKLEQYYQDHRNYGALGTTDCANETPPSWATFAPNSAKFFTFSCALTSNGNNQGYVLTATGSQSRAVGHVYTLDHDDVKGTPTFKGATSTKPCWLVKGSEC